MKSTASTAPINHNDAGRLLDPAIAAFIRAHDGTDTDAHALALKKWPDDTWPRTAVLNQIAARAKARDKLPAWHAQPGILFPRPDVVEQASSQACALYKASLFPGIRRFVDMTGGAGIDSWALARTVGASGIAFEQDHDTAFYLAHNMRLMTEGAVQVTAGDSVAAMAGMPACDLIIADPARRTQNARGLFRLADLSPALPALLPAMKEKAAQILIKSSPMLDITQARAELGADIGIDVVEWRGQCRELLIRINAPDARGATRAVCIDDDGIPLWQIQADTGPNIPAPTGAPGSFLFEPAPGIHKAALTDILAHRHGLRRLHPNTHLLTGPEPVPGFPGRVFALRHVLRVNAAELRHVLPDGRASISVRNFPMSAQALKEMLKTQESDEITVFGVRLQGGNTALLVGQKL